MTFSQRFVKYFSDVCMNNRWVSRLAFAVFAVYFVNGLMRLTADVLWLLAFFLAPDAVQGTSV